MDFFLGRKLTLEKMRSCKNSSSSNIPLERCSNTEGRQAVFSIQTKLLLFPMK